MSYTYATGTSQRRRLARTVGYVVLGVFYVWYIDELSGRHLSWFLRSAAGPLTASLRSARIGPVWVWRAPGEVSPAAWEVSALLQEARSITAAAAHARTT